MRDRKQIREAIEGVTAETGGWDSPPTWGQIADVLAALLAGIVEAHRAWQEWRAHAATCPACMAKVDGNPCPAPTCKEGQRLAAAVNGVGGAK